MMKIKNRSGKDKTTILTVMIFSIILLSNIALATNLKGITGIYSDAGSTTFFGSCAAGSSIRAISATGSVTCETDTDNNYYPTTFAWTGGTTSGPTGSLTGRGMSPVSFAAIPAASATASGIITTGTQTIAGAKTFSNTIIGSISGNADTVDSLHAASFLRSDASDVWNDAGSAIDLRFEGDTDTNLLFLDGSADAIGIGTSSPSGKLTVKKTSFSSAATIYGIVSDLNNQIDTNVLNTYAAYFKNNVFGQSSANRYGLYSEAVGDQGVTTYGIYATAASGDTNYAGYFASGSVRVGSGGTNTYATGSGELYVQNDLEVDGASYLNTLTVSSTASFQGNVNLGNGLDLINLDGCIPLYYWEDAELYDHRFFCSAGTSSFSGNSICSALSEVGCSEARYVYDNSVVACSTSNAQAKKVKCYGMGCLIETSLITLSNNKVVPIKDLKVGNKIKAYNETSRKIEEAVIEKVLVHNEIIRKTDKVSFSNSAELIVTPNHPILTKEGKWTPVQELKVGDLVFQINKRGELEEVQILSIIREFSEQETVYNLKTSLGNYFAEDILVHNKCVIEGTLIDTPDGLKRIEDLRPGDIVYGTKNGKRVETKIVALYEKEVVGSIPGKILLNGEIVTNNHIIEYEGKEMMAVSTNLPDYEITGKVYDLETETGDYFVNGIRTVFQY